MFSEFIVLLGINLYNRNHGSTFDFYQASDKAINWINDLDINIWFTYLFILSHFYCFILIYNMHKNYTCLSITTEVDIFW